MNTSLVASLPRHEIKKFADAAGLVVTSCGPGWGGRWGYRTSDDHNCTIAGFKTKTEARVHWFAETFGEKAGNAIIDLMRRAK